MITLEKMLPKNNTECNISIFILTVAMFTLVSPYTEYPTHGILIPVLWKKQNEN